MKIRSRLRLFLYCNIAAVTIGPFPCAWAQSNIGTISASAGKLGEVARQAGVSVDDMILDWAESMHATPAPHSGCFTAAYPSLVWIENQCVDNPYVPSALGVLREESKRIGGSNDGSFNYDMIASSAAPIQRVDGAIPIVAGYTSVADSTYGTNNFSVQINTNHFQHNYCNNANVPSKCFAWQQFVFWNGTGSNPYFSGIGIQYWLINYGYKNDCPSGWARDGNAAYPGPDCFLTNQGQAYSTTNPNIIKGLVMSAQSTPGGNDSLKLWSPTIPGLLQMTATDSVLSLANRWTQVQFNVFGHGSFSQAQFNTGAGMSTQITAYDASGNFLPTSCLNNNLTGEGNNLSSIGACCPGAPNTGSEAMLNTAGLNSSLTAPFCMVTELSPFP